MKLFIWRMKVCGSNFATSKSTKNIYDMSLSQKISLATLAGLILPFGNIWGPLIIKIPKNSSEVKFRHRLIILETIISFIFFSSSIVLLVKSMLAGYSISLIRLATYILLIHNILILIIAVIAASLYKSNS